MEQRKNHNSSVEFITQQCSHLIGTRRKDRNDLKQKIMCVILLKYKKNTKIHLNFLYLDHKKHGDLFMKHIFHLNNKKSV